MNDRISPAVDVTIGGQTRIYHAFITTAPIALDGPSTLTLYESCFADVAGFAADPIPFDRALGKASARLVLVGSTELVWQRARYREGQCLFTPTDPVLVGLNTLPTGAATVAPGDQLPNCSRGRSVAQCVSERARYQ
jgi:hypothetical protein